MFIYKQQSFSWTLHIVKLKKEQKAKMSIKYTNLKIIKKLLLKKGTETKWHRFWKVLICHYLTDYSKSDSVS